MNKEFSMEPERAILTTPVPYLGEASRAAASFNRALRARHDARICNSCVSCAGSLSLGR